MKKKDYPNMDTLLSYLNSAEYTSGFESKGKVVDKQDLQLPQLRDTLRKKSTKPSDRHKRNDKSPSPSTKTVSIKFPKAKEIPELPKRKQFHIQKLQRKQAKTLNLLLDPSKHYEKKQAKDFTEYEGNLMNNNMLIKTINQFSTQKNGIRTSGFFNSLIKLNSSLKDKNLIANLFRSGVSTYCEFAEYY